ncbi:MAG: hypothetical protein WDN24_21550 [Sphingomonas sp.]
MANEIAQTGRRRAPVRSNGLRIVHGRSWLAFGGIGFIYGAVFVFGVVCYMLIRDDGSAGAFLANGKPAPTLADYIPELILSSIGAFGAILGVGLLRSVGIAGSQQPNRVINSEEWAALADQVKNGQEEAVTPYIRLTSLTGFTGAFYQAGPHRAAAGDDRPDPVLLDPVDRLSHHLHRSRQAHAGRLHRLVRPEAGRRLGGQAAGGRPAPSPPLP